MPAQQEEAGVVQEVSQFAGVVQKGMSDFGSTVVEAGQQRITNEVLASIASLGSNLLKSGLGGAKDMGDQITPDAPLPTITHEVANEGPILS